MKNLQTLNRLIKEELEKTLDKSKVKTPNTDISLNGKAYTLHLDVNKNPTKKGIKVQLTPLDIEPTGKLNTDKKQPQVEKNDDAIEVLAKLNEGLKKFGLEADIDPDVPYKNVIGFYIRLQYFDKIVRDALSNTTQKVEPKPIQNEKPKVKAEA